MKQALQALIAEMEYVLSCINEDKIPFDGDDFHEALRLAKEALAQPEQERCVGCEACIDTACGRDECPKGWPKAAQPEQEPVAWIVHDRIAPDRLTFVEVKESLQTEVTPLYTTPPQRTWEGLSVFEINDLVASTEHGLHDLVERTEAKLKEKNT